MSNRIGADAAHSRAAGSAPEPVSEQTATLPAGRRGRRIGLGTLSVVTVARLLAALIAAEVERARRRHELTSRELAIIAEGAMRRRPRARIAARLPGRSVATIHQTIHKLRERGLLWVPAALRRPR